MSVTEADLDYRIRILKSAPLFADATDEDIAGLARLGKVIAAERGTMLAKRGFEGSQIFVVQSGVGAELHFELGDQKPILVKLHGRGSTAGVVCAVIRDARRADPTGGPTPARRAEALTNMTVLVLPAADFLRLCRRNADLGAALARQLAEQSDLIARTYARSTHYTLEMRLAAFFSRVSGLIATDDWNPVINVGKISQSSIATMLGVSREHVNRTIAMWERSGLIFQNKSGDFIVENAKRLAQLALSRTERSAHGGEDDFLWEIDTHLDRGLNQAALHLALEASRRAPKDKRYSHRAVLATARLGAISEALNLIEKWRLDGESVDEERACLRPRLLRDLAFARNPKAPDAALLRQSAQGYDEIFRAFRGFYSGVNAAAGYALIHQLDKAKELASRVCEIIAQTDTDDSDNYWRRTTLAECKLLQGDKAAAANLFEAVSRAPDATPGKAATTRKQLRRLSTSIDIDDTWINRVSPQAGVMFYSGPLAREVADEKDLPTDALLNALNKFLAERPVGWAYGALAAGADIIIAEALIKAGVTLNIFLPLPPEEFLRHSVDVAGPGWRERFVACMRGASSIEWIRHASAPCDSGFKLGAIRAMGQTLRHAAQLETEATGFFAVQKGMDASNSLSIASAELWSAGGGGTVKIYDDWPVATNGRFARSSSDHALLYAMVIQQRPGAAPPEAFSGAGDWRVRSEDGELSLFLFDRLEEALARAASFADGAGTATACCWLDAGVFSKADLTHAPVKALDCLITSACRPVTEPGKIFASESFVCSAALGHATGATFEYVGFSPTREKLNPCALHIVLFKGA